MTLLIWTNLNSRDAFSQVWVELAQWFWRWRSLNFIMSLLAPLGTSFKHIWIIFPQARMLTFLQSLGEIGSMVWEKKSFKCRQRFFTMSLLSTLGKGCGPLLVQTWFPFYTDLVEIGPVVIERKMEMWKINRRTDRQFTGDQKNSLEHSAQVS